MNRHLNRRQLLQTAGCFTVASLLPLGIQGWVARTKAQNPNPNRLIVLFLRGGVDGLSLVVPYRDIAYYQMRPTIALSAPGDQGNQDSVIDLDGQFGLHPRLAPLMPLWQQKSLAWVHAAGSPDPTRSHFDAQDYMESGTPGVKSTNDGWMNRLLEVLPQESLIQAVNLGKTMPRILRGTENVVSVPTGQPGLNHLLVDRRGIQTTFARLYSGTAAIDLAYQEGLQARKILLAELEEERLMASRGAGSAVDLATDARKLAQLMRGDTRTQLAFMAIGGWDTHVNQTNLLNRYLQPLGEGLATLVRELGDLYRKTTIVVLSEFGRTVAENGNQGTDHGRGTTIAVLGGQVQGGQVLGDWPGLEPSQLVERRYLPVTTDFRDVIGTILHRQLGLKPTQLAQVFPDYTVRELTL